MNPLPNAEKFIQTVLGASADLTALIGNGIYSGVPPSGGPFPCVVFSLRSAGATLAVGRNVTVLDLPEYTIKAVTTGDDYGEAHDIMQAVTEALKDASGEVVYNNRAYWIQGVRQLSDWFEFPEFDEKRTRYNHVGQNFRLFASNGRIVETTP